MKLSPRIIALALPLLWSCSTDDLTSVHPSATPRFDAAPANLPLVYDVENTGAGFAAPVFPSFDQLPVDSVLPDPFRSFAGGPADVTFASWSRRRAEIKASIESYEIGAKPDPADVDVSARVVAPAAAPDTLYVLVTRRSNGKSLTLRSVVNLPAGTGPFPAIIGMTWFGSGGTGSLPADIFTSRNIARIPFYHDQVTTYFSFSGHGNDPFFQLYPEYNVGNGNYGQYAAWSWGVSRLIDGLVLAARQGLLPIDVSHLAVTGCSYAGKMALFAGAFDERVALTIAQESGGGGMPAWRVSEAMADPRGAVEHIDNTNYTWFANQMRQFGGGNVYKLPHDHHELMAMVAPRALLATNNYDYIWLANPAAYISARATQEAYNELGIGDRFGFIIDGSATGSSHSHCQVPASQRPIIQGFVDKFLLGNASANTDAQVTPYPDFSTPAGNYPPWMPWAVPWSIRGDVTQLVAAGTLTADQGAGLMDKLNAAVASLMAGNRTPALNQLNAFINQVNAFVRIGALTPAQGTALTAKAEAARKRFGA